MRLTAPRLDDDAVADDDLLAERVRVLYRRSVLGIPLTGATLAVLNALMFALTRDLRFGYPALAAMLVQGVRFWDVRGYLQADAARRCSPRTALLRYGLGVLLFACVWNFNIFTLRFCDDILSTLGALLVLAAAYVGNVLALAPVLRLAAVFVLTTSVPPSLALLYAPQAQAVPMGMTGLVWTVLMLLVAETSFRITREALRKARLRQQSRPPGPRPRVRSQHEQWFAERRTVLLYKRGFIGVVVSVCLAFAISVVILSHSDTPSVWLWLLAALTIETVRAADIAAYQRKLHRQHDGACLWVVRFVICQAGSVSVWYLLLWFVYPHVDLFGRLFVLGALAVLAVGSLLLTSVSRSLSLLYMFSMLVPVLGLWLKEAGTGRFVLGLLCLFLLVMLVVVSELLYRMTMDAVYVKRLKAQAEEREQQTRALNDELSQARSHLVEANATLEHKVIERTAELERLANEDPLTGLYNRNRFSALTHAAIDAPDSEAVGFAVYFVDLDRFKEINDGLGHPAGDAVLRAVAQRILAVCGEHVACARWGGDEFVLLHRGPVDEVRMQCFGEHLLQSIAEPIEAYHTSVAASVGIALYPRHGRTAAELVEHADIAVYKAKQSGRSTVCVYEPQWGIEARRRLDLVQALRRAIESESLSLHYQPIIDLPGGRLHSVEALLRWTDPERGPIPPVQFISLAEDSGLIVALGRFALRRACATMQHLYPDANGPIVAVNASVAQIGSKEFIADVRAALADSGLPPQRLELEVTESLFAGNLEAVKATLQQLRLLGVRISIDDFGTGYSAMSYLSSLPLDTLKIDRAFVKGLDEGRDAIFATLIRLAESLRLEVIVEGVETSAELQRVIELGGRCVQGYYFAKPMPPEALVSECEGIVSGARRVEQFFARAAGS